MSEHVDIDKQVRIYVTVFVSLFVLTIVTVAVSYLDVSVPVALTIGLFIATVKGSLVACFFMHLIDEKKIVYWTLALTVAFFIALMALPLLTSVADQVGEFAEVEAHEAH